MRYSIFHMYVELDMSLRSIAHKLTEDKIPTPTQKYNPESTYGTVWTHTTVYDFLRDTSNIGVLTICRRKNVIDAQGKLRREPHPEKKVIPGGIPRIIPQGLFERAQRKLALNQVEKSTKPKDPTLHLLRGHARCGSCENRMCTRVYKGIPYYHCSNRRNKYKCCPDIPAVCADLVDQLAWEECCVIFERIDSLQTTLEGEIQQALVELLEDTTGQEQLASLQATIEYTKRERDKHDEGSYMYNLINQDIITKKEQVERFVERFKEECTSASSIAAATALYHSRVVEFLDFLNVMRGKYEKSSFQEKRNALDVLGVCAHLQAIPEEERLRGKVPTLAEIKSRMNITYSPIFASTGVQPSGDGLPQNQ